MKGVDEKQHLMERKEEKRGRQTQSVRNKMKY